MSALIWVFVLVSAAGAAWGDPSPAGGRESIPHPQPLVESGFRFRFPIAEEDYLMLSSPYGWRVSPTLAVVASHDGIDIATIPQAQVIAAADGIVEEPYPPPGTLRWDGRVYRGHPIYGGCVTIRHADGLRTLYAHLSALYVVVGQRVRAGQVIGRVGSTGKSTGRHLHFEVRWGELALNPLLYVALPGTKG